MNFVGTSNSESVCTNHPSQLYASCSINFRETDQDDLYGRIRLGEANIINRTGTGQVNVLWYRCIRGERQMTIIRRMRAIEEEKYGYHGCSTVIIFRRIIIDYMYPAQIAQGVRFHVGEDLLTKTTPRNVDILSIKKKRDAPTPTFS